MDINSKNSWIVHDGKALELHGFNQHNHKAYNISKIYYVYKAGNSLLKIYDKNDNSAPYVPPYTPPYTPPTPPTPKAIHISVDGYGWVTVYPDEGGVYDSTGQGTGVTWNYNYFFNELKNGQIEGNFVY